MHTFILRRREGLDRALLAACVLAPLAFVALGLWFDGYAERRFLWAYVAPFFVALPLWARCRLRRGAAWSRGEMALDAAVVTLGALRFTGGFLPFSGHTLFFVYSGLTERTGWYRVVALVLLAETAYFKLVLWSDPWSFGLGIVLALGFAAAHRRVTR
jgi:hypothetical protein